MNSSWSVIDVYALLWGKKMVRNQDLNISVMNHR